jgi:hypothetical protein
LESAARIHDSIWTLDSGLGALPDDIAALKAALIAEAARAAYAEAQLALTKAKGDGTTSLIVRLLIRRSR